MAFPFGVPKSVGTGDAVCWNNRLGCHEVLRVFSFLRRK